MSQAVPQKQQTPVPGYPEKPFCGELLSTGSEWVVDATGCDPVRLARQSVLQSLCEAIIADNRLNVIGSPQWHTFPSPGGVTGLYLLSESHLACHSFPEHQLLTVNLYCCRDHADWDWTSQLERRFGAMDVVLRKMDRGILPSGDSVSSGDVV